LQRAAALVHLPAVVGREKFAARKQPDASAAQWFLIGKAQPFFTEDAFGLQRLRVAIVVTDGLGHARSLKRPRRRGQPSGTDGVVTSSRRLRDLANQQATLATGCAPRKRIALGKSD